MRVEEGTASVRVDTGDTRELVVVVFTDTTIAFVDDVGKVVAAEEGFAGTKEDFTKVGVQSPKPAWQPLPQYAEVEPQYPALEQQFPNTEFSQVRRLLDCVPQRAVVLHLRASAPRNGRAATANSKAECIAIVDRQNE